jgi:hypothetical protein
MFAFQFQYGYRQDPEHFNEEFGSLFLDALPITIKTRITAQAGLRTGALQRLTGVIGPAVILIWVRLKIIECFYSSTCFDLGRPADADRPAQPCADSIQSRFI